MEINININNLTELIDLIKDIVGKISSPKPVNKSDAETKPVGTAAPTPGPSTALTAQTAAAPAAPAQTAQAIKPQQPSLPTASKKYTFEEIATAATKLMRDKGEDTREKLKALNEAFNVVSLKELKSEDYSEYAMKLREMGAEI